MGLGNVIRYLLTGLFLLGAVSAHADETCTLRFNITADVAHGGIAAGETIRGEISFRPVREMKLGAETVSYLTEGDARISAGDGTQITGRLGVIHVTRTPHFADYISLDVTQVAGNLGGIEEYEDPLLVTLYAPRETLDSFDLPRGTDQWNVLSKRQVFQVHTPDTMWTFPGKVSELTEVCGS